MDRFMRNPVLAALAALGFLILLGSTISIVPETQQGVIVRFGQPVRILNPYKPAERFGQTGAGLAARIPFAEQVVWIDKRIQSVKMERQQVLSTDQLRLQVDAYARYRITNPLRMYVSAGSEQRVEEALRPILGSALRNELGKRPFVALLSPERGQVMNNIRAGLNRVARQYGAEVIDVRIKRADLPDGTPLESAFQRMRTARQQEALTIRAQGEKQAQIIRAEADAQAAMVYAASFGKDPQFYDFYRAMQAYRRTFNPANGGQTSVILSPDNDFLREFRGR
tara:strand:+ start:1067 stop:1912 length:846 start_codon:yes stop_codon:yes gene_type:complete